MSEGKKERSRDTKTEKRYLKIVTITTLTFREDNSFCKEIFHLNSKGNSHDKKGGGANLNRIESPPYPASLIGQIRIRGQATSACISLSFPTPDPQLNLRNPTTSGTHKRFIVVVAETASPFSAITDKCEVP